MGRRGRGRRVRGFNPRSREGNDMETIPSDTEGTKVSIHVPARGTTALPPVSPEVPPVSIHVPARGTTAAGFYFMGANDVSIHVPARGTTRSIARRFFTIALFQSTFPRGERQNKPDMLRTYWRFNPRSREGNDMTEARIYQDNGAFQSTFPRGERLLRLL